MVTVYHSGLLSGSGIHIGTETTFLAKKFPNVHIYSIEPSKRNCFYIMWNLLLNGIKPSQVTVLHKFFGSEVNDNSKLVDWGMRQGGSEGAWMRTGAVEEEDGEVGARARNCLRRANLTGRCPAFGFVRSLQRSNPNETQPRRSYGAKVSSILSALST
eukprot:COSAG05_NODE_2371_length_3162_cov_2.346066_3_plen_158_part_00